MRKDETDLSTLNWVTLKLNFGLFHNLLPLLRRSKFKRYILSATYGVKGMDPQNISSVPSNLFSPEMYQEDTCLILYSLNLEIRIQRFIILRKHVLRAIIRILHFPLYEMIKDLLIRNIYW